MNAPRTQTVLFVDDDTTYRTRLIRAFTERGYDTLGASNCTELREILQIETRKELYGAVVDLRMPGESGLHAIETILAHYPQSNVVVLTGFGSIATALQAMRLGAIDYLTKPVDVERILSSLDSLQPNAPNEHSDAAGTEIHPSEEQIPVPSLERVEWEHIQRVLAQYDGNISKSAQALGIHRRSLQRKLQKAP